MKTILNTLTTILISTIILTGCGGEPDKKARLEELKKQKGELQDEIDSLEKDLFGKGDALRMESVTIDTISKSDFQHFFEVHGTTEAEKNVLLNSETAGLIRKVNVEEGQKVQRGQTLMILDAEMIAKNILEVEKSLELANFVFEKQSNLHDQNIGSELQFQQAKNNKERLEETLKTLKAQQGKSVVSAPFTGYVDKIFMHEGEMAMPQIPLIRLLDITKIKITADVMETYLKDVKPSTLISVKISALGDTLIENLPLTRIGKFVNPNNRSFVIETKITNKNERLLPNLVASIIVSHSVMKDVFVIPASALLQSSSGQNYIYVMETEKGKDKKMHKVVKKIIVERVATNRLKKVSVIQDLPGENKLKEGQLLIVGGARGVKPGMEVKVK